MSDTALPPQQPGPSPHPVPGGSKRRQITTLAVLLLLTGALIGASWYFTRSQAVNAKVGDCVANSGSDSVKIVGCSDSKAAYVVVGRVENKTRSEAGYLSTVCDAYQDKGAESMYWHGEQGKKGYVLCLAKHSG